VILQEIAGPSGWLEAPLPAAAALAQAELGKPVINSV